MKAGDTEGQADPLLKEDQDEDITWQERLVRACLWFCQLLYYQLCQSNRFQSFPRMAPPLVCFLSICQHFGDANESCLKRVYRRNCFGNL